MAFGASARSLKPRLSKTERFSGFVNGIFDLTAVVYYLSLVVLFVWLATQAMDKKRWS